MSGREAIQPTFALTLVLAEYSHPFEKSDPLRFSVVVSLPSAATVPRHPIGAWTPTVFSLPLLALAE